MKVYARQINPEHQESPLHECFFEELDTIAVFGNHRMTEHRPSTFYKVWDVLTDLELAEMIVDIEAGRADQLFQYTTVKDAVTDMLPPVDREEYTSEEVKALRDAVVGYDQSIYEADENTNLCKALSVVTGGEWDWRTIHGSTQDEWQEIFFAVDDWSEDSLSELETEYFNTGTEWVIHDQEEDPRTPDEITGYTVYCHSCDEDEIRAELANVAGCAPAELVMYKWLGVRLINVYEEV